MKKFTISLSVLFVFVLTLLPYSSFAATSLGTFKLGGSSHWGSAPCSTSYRFMELRVVTQHPDSYAGVRLQYKSYATGQWTEMLDYGIQVLKGSQGYVFLIKPSSSTAQYRVFVETYPNSYTTGYVTCQGVN